jgi:hypothetical protein
MSLRENATYLAQDPRIAGAGVAVAGKNYPSKRVSHHGPN